MARTKKDIRALSIIFNLIIVVWMAYCAYHFFIKGLEGNMVGGRFSAFMYYTIDSNFFVAVSSLAMLIARLVNGTPKSFAVKFKYFGTCTVTITLLTVLVFLGPSMGYKLLLSGDNLYMHLIGPLLCIISFCFLDRGPRVRMSHAVGSLIPTLIYGTVYSVMVLILKKWPDFYGFNTVTKWYISFPVMIAAAFLVAVLLKALHNDKC